VEERKTPRKTYR